MVQVIQTGNPQGKLSEMLGMSLGQGLGNGLNTYFANRSLESVLQDKSLEGKPQSEKFEALRSALAPYGDRGKELFEQRMQIEQQALSEKEQIKSEKLQKKKGSALGRYLKGQELTDEENELFTPQEFVAMHKARQPKAPPGGLSGQPIPLEDVNKIEQVRQKFPNADASKLGLELARAGVRGDLIKSEIETQRRVDESNQKKESSEEKLATATDIKFHEASKDYEATILKDAKSAKKQLETIEPIEKSIREGKVKPSSASNIFRAFGKTGEKIADALLNKDEAKLLASVPEFLEGRKELFGVRLSDADLKLLQDKLPDIGKSKEANLAILELMKKYANRSILKEQAANNVLKNKGISLKNREGKLRPLNYENLVEEEFDRLLSNEKSFDNLPDASLYNGKKARDKKTGQIFKSDGTNWVPQ